MFWRSTTFYSRTNSQSNYKFESRSLILDTCDMWFLCCIQRKQIYPKFLDRKSRLPMGKIRILSRNSWFLTFRAVVNAALYKWCWTRVLRYENFYFSLNCIWKRTIVYSIVCITPVIILSSYFLIFKKYLKCFSIFLKTF